MLLPPVAGCDAAEASPPPYYSHRWLGHPSTHPHPLLFCGDGSLTPQRTSEPSYSSTSGHPLPRLPRLRVVPFLGLFLIHRPGALGAAWSTWSTNNSHWKRLTVGVHTRKCLLIMRKIMIPPPDSWDPPEGPLYFLKKMSRPPTVSSDPPAISSHTSKCLLITHKK